MLKFEFKEKSDEIWSEHKFAQNLIKTNEILRQFDEFWSKLKS